MFFNVAAFYASIDGCLLLIARDGFAPQHNKSGSF